MASIKYTDHKTEDIMRYWFIYNDGYGYNKEHLSHSLLPVMQYVNDHNQHMYKWMLFTQWISLLIVHRIPKITTVEV